jgi:hypothetical protein
MVSQDTTGTFATRPAEPGRSFSVLWSHTLLDNPSHSDRRGSKTPITETKPFPVPRLAGMDHYEVMLTRPLFLFLDALLDERTQLFMTAKSWLNSLVGVDKYVSPSQTFQGAAAHCLLQTLPRVCIQVLRATFSESTTAHGY